MPHRTMTGFNHFSIKVKNFKCFGELPNGFECIKPVNLIIGRNNSGKSTLLDLVEYSTQEKMDVPPPLWNSNKKPEFIARIDLSEDNVKRVFPESVSGGGIPGRNHFEFGRKLIGAYITWRADLQPNQRFLDLSASPDGSQPFANVSQDKNTYLQKLANSVTNPLFGKLFRRIHAERNISPETDNPGNLNISGDGVGTTNLIQNFLNKASLPSNLVEVTLLSDLNSIFGQDAHFSRILCQQLSDSKWEIYLEEDSKGRIPLSQSGSGLKTIILVLAYVHLLPAVEKKNLSQFIFGFEELENNLHPSLLRKLLTYIKDHANKNKCIFFLTTHSNVAIDLLNKNKNAQILHVTHDKTIAFVKTVTTYIESRGILDDLDVRASDLLQSNCVIWVEGPSDRIYLNRWISIWSDGELSEGNHYQCVFYGGRLLAHLSSLDPDIIQGGLSILRVNRNSMIMIDSDKRNQQTRLNDTKQRIISEIESNSGISWVTKGREVENYIPARVIAKWLGVGIEQVTQSEQYENFFTYLDGIKDGKGKYYSSRKPLLAEELGPHFLKNDLNGVLDLSQRINDVCTNIRKWNNMQHNLIR